MVSSISSYSASQIRQIDIPTFATADVAALSASQIRELTTSQISAMNSAQIGAIETADFVQLTGKQISAFDPSNFRDGLLTYEKNKLQVITGS